MIERGFKMKLSVIRYVITIYEDYDSQLGETLSIENFWKKETHHDGLL